MKKDTPIVVILKEMQKEVNKALDSYKLMNDSIGKTKNIATEDYANSVRQISVLNHAIEKLNSV